MSEGPQVLRRTQWIHKYLAGRRVLRCQSMREDIPADALNGSIVRRSFCKGKHIFIEFDNGRYLHNHLLMRGTWRKLDGQQLFLPEQTWLSLYVGPYTVCNLQGQMLKLVAQDEVDRQCASLGPDTMSDPYPAEAMRTALAATSLPISEALLSQSVIAGVGNIAKSESLFLAAVDPRVPGCQLTAAEIDRLLEAIRVVMWGSYHKGGRWTRRVYQRRGQHCEQCRTLIRSIRIPPSKRATYYCPRCQDRAPLRYAFHPERS